MDPLWILGIGIVIVIGMIIVLKLNAFIALITAAIVVSLLAPGATEDKISRVAEAFGSSAGAIGIVIALAAVIGKCMMDSGAADRIVRAFLNLLGEKRSPVALMGSGFVLAVPVFFDTVFYLLVPLARSFYRRTGKNYLKCILAIAAGGAITHTLVPPTPGPLVMADQLGIDVGLMILVGAMVAIPAAIVGLIFAGIADRIWNIPLRPIPGQKEPEALDDSELPALWLSLLPVLLPVLLISANTLAGTFAEVNEETGANVWAQMQPFTAVLGNPNLALLLSAAVALITYCIQRNPTRAEFADLVEISLMSGGVIILITAAGGAFGAMLKEAQIRQAIEEAFGKPEASGMFLLFFGFGIAALLKVAQGSSTVAMITGSSLLASMVVGDAAPPYNVVYLATAIGAGSLIGSWMNDSGFWIFTKMGGLTEVESLKTWTVLLIVLGLTSFGMTLVLANVLPLTDMAAVTPGP